MEHQLKQEGCQWVLNPASWNLTFHIFSHGTSIEENWLHIAEYTSTCPGMATWANEDYIGRINRCSRKVQSIKVAIHTIRKSLVQYRNEWRSALERKSQLDPSG